MRRILVSALFLAGVCASAVAAVVQVDLGTPPAKPGQATETAIFAGGCFWCTEADFDKVPGVISTTSGYTGGHLENPSYAQVSAGGTGHAEAVKVVFDPNTISYPKLLQHYWLSIDPLTPDQQFCDHGSQYRTAIFYLDERQKTQALAYRQSLQDSHVFSQPIVTEITAASTFYPAEDSHQDYHLKNPVRYAYYRKGCGRDARLELVWGRRK